MFSVRRQVVLFRETLTGKGLMREAGVGHCHEEVDLEQPDIASKQQVSGGSHLAFEAFWCGHTSPCC